MRNSGTPELIFFWPDLEKIFFRYLKLKPDCGLAGLACSSIPDNDLRSMGCFTRFLDKPEVSGGMVPGCLRKSNSWHSSFLDHLDYLSHKKARSRDRPYT